MTNPTPEAAVQRALFALLPGAAPVVAAFADKGPVQIFDYVPRGADGRPTKPYPFMAFSTAQSVGGENPDDCDDEQEVFQDIEVLDDATKRGKMGTKELCSAVRQVAAKPLAVAGFNCTLGQAVTIRHFDPDDGVARSIVTLRYVLDPA